MRLSLPQKQIYYMEMFNKDAINVNCGTVLLDKLYDVRKIEKAINEVFRINEALRTKIYMKAGEPHQYFSEYAEKAVEVLYFNSKAEVHSYGQTQAQLPMDLFDELCQIKIISSEEFCGVFYKVHHIISDAATLSLIGSQINKLLEDEPVEAFSYSDYIVEEEKYLSSKRALRDKSFFCEQHSEMSNLVYLSDIPPARGKGERKICSIDKELSCKIRQFAADKGVSEYTVFLTAVSAYIAKRKNYSGNFYIGTPVLNRSSISQMNTAGMFVNNVPFPVRIEADKSFNNQLEKTKDTFLTVLKHQRFNYICALNELNIDQSYDVSFSFQNSSIYGEGFKSTWYHNGVQAESLQIHIDDRDNEGVFNISYDYHTERFTEKDICSIHNHLINLIIDATDNPEKNISDFEMLSGEEKQRVLYDFNETSSSYPKDKCIHELFEEQAEKTPDKTALVAADKTLTYRELNEEANRIANSLIEKGIGRGDIVGLMLPRKSYLLSALFGILKTGAAYLPIDSELPAERIEYMCRDTDARLVISDENIEMLLAGEKTTTPCVKMTNDALCYCIYTSGSTGQPKAVMARHRNVVNYISKSEHNIAGKVITDDFEAIVSISTCSFDIFITETVLPLVNGLRTVLADEQQCRNQYALNKLLSKEKGEFLQTTPTKFKVLTADPTQREFLKNVKAIMLGGEAMERSYLRELRKITNAKIYNIYGATEVPIWSTFADTETFTDAVTIGKPIANTQVYILDKYLKPVPIGVTGELCIAGDSVSAGYLGRPELTAEKFIDNPFGEGKMYRTGDNAYWREDGNIVFIGRSDFQVKIRGLRIELGEIETAIQAIEGIERAVVVVRKDSEARQLICAFYTGEVIPAKTLREEIGRTLPKYMIPHIFTHLEKMPLTSSGKANRNALPEIDLENISTDTEYVAPETGKEKLLTECICDILKAEKVSVLDNFFDIGGDSLKAIELTARLEEKGYTVAVKTIFSCKNIRELAGKLEEKEQLQIKIEYSSIMPATSAQMRVYTAQMLKPDSTMYNITYAFKTEQVNKDRLERAINKLIERHESLRTRFENRDGQIVQIIEGKAETRIEYTENPDSFIKAFDLGTAPLVRVGCNADTVVVSLHHIITDGESMPVFFRELNELYMGRSLPDTVQYGEFAVSDGYSEENEKYWLEIFNEEIPTLELPTDYARASQQSFAGSNIYEQIDKRLHERIEEKCKEAGITPYVYYMACFSILLSKLSGSEDIVSGTPISGRSSRYLNTVGMFVNTIALRSKPEGNKTVAELLSEIRDSSIEAMDNQVYPFGELVKKLAINTAGRNPLFDVMFAYQNFKMTDITFGDEKAELIPLETKASKCDMTFNVLPRTDDVVLAIEYCTDLFSERRIAIFAQMYISLLEQCIDDKKCIKDISVTDTKLISSFNETEADYAKDKCIHELFEEQAEKTPDKTALVAVDKTLTYRELNEEANRIANSLIEKGICRGDIVGILLPRRSYFLSALFGVLKTGAAYLPLDPEHPEERIRGILRDSNAKICISEDNIFDLLDNHNSDKPVNSAEPDNLCYCIYTSGSTGAPKGTLLYHINLVWYMSVLKDIYGTDNINMPFFTSQSVDLSVPTYYLPVLTGGTVYLYNGELKENLIDIFNNENLTVLKFTPTHMSIICKLIPDKLCKNVRYVIVGGETLYTQTAVEFLDKFGKHIEIHNEYGPTETTVSCTDYIFDPQYFDGESYLPIGAPISNAQVYILDKYMNPVPIGVAGEICIAGDGVGAGYLGRPDLTAEKFIDNPFGEGKMYRTGDNAYWREDGNIVFVGRSDFQVKIRGLRIELGEIESALQSVEGIDRAVVVVRKDKSDRQLICAFCTGEEKSNKELREKLSVSLPKYMIPHIFTHLEKMPLTPSGKADRNALPEIDLENISTDTEYVAPETEKEKALSDAMCSVLNIGSINMIENFFNIGGDSIKAIYIVSKLEEKGYELHIADIMQKDTLYEVAQAIKPISYKAIYEQKEVNGLIPYSPIMRAYLKYNNEIPLDYVHTCIISAKCNEDIAKIAIDKLVFHHDMLRGTFYENGIRLRGSYERKAYSFKSITIDDKNEAIEYLKDIITDEEKLVNIVFCKTKKENLISITVHHFLIDLISWEVLISDFYTVIEQLNKGEQVLLPEKTASFMLWSEELQKYSKAVSEEIKDYWESINEKLDCTESIQSFDESENEEERFSYTFDKDFSKRLIREANESYGTKTNEVLLTALGLAAREIANGSVGIMVEGHGRTELHKSIAIERTVGWFTVCYPIVIDNSKDSIDVLIDTKETLRRIPRNGIDYLLLSQGFHKNVNIKFNFYRSSMSEEHKTDLVSFSAKSVFPGMINVDCFIKEDIVTVNISVSKCKHKQNICEKLGFEFVSKLRELVDICSGNEIVIKTCSDFTDEELTEIELEELKDLFDGIDDNEQK